MNNKRHKEDNQLSLTLELPGETARVACPAVSAIQQRSAGVIAFPNTQFHAPSFRERVIQDLMKTRVMVAD